MPGKKGNPGTYPRHLGKPTGKGYFQSDASGFLRKASDKAGDVRQGDVGRDEADFTPGFGTRHPQDVKQLGQLDDPKPIPGARLEDKQHLSKSDLAISDEEIEASVREGRPPRVGF